MCSICGNLHIYKYDIKMKLIIEKIASMSILYGVAVILMYSLLIAEYLSAVNTLCMKDMVEVSGVIEFLFKFNYLLSILSSIITWIILSLMFHLVALLFDGRQVFVRFLFTSSYLYIIPAVFLIVSIIMLGNMEVEDSNTVEALMGNDRFRLIMDTVNYSFIPFYVLMACFIHYMYNIKWIYGILSVAIPILSIWGVTELFKLL